MFFRRKKEPAPAKAATAAAGATASGTDEPSTAFLLGDPSVDRKAVEVLLKGIAKVSTSRDIEGLLSDIVDTSIEVTGAERGLLILDDGESGPAVRMAREKSRKPVTGEVRYSTTVVKKVLTDREPVRAQVSSDSAALELGSSFHDLKLRAVMCVPLVQESGGEGAHERGVLYVDSRAATREFSPRDLALFAALSQYIRIALQNARLHIVSLEKARLDQSLLFASQIQKDLMGELPRDVPGYELYGWYGASEGTTGDFYDCVRMKSGRLAVFMGDVTGHGIGPALIMAEAKAALRQGLKFLDDPAAVVRSVSEDLAPRLDDTLFFTLFVATFAPDGGLQTLNAGHTPPLIWRARTKKVEAIEGHAPAVGFVDDFPYEPGPPGKLEPGDVLVAYTDGFAEARKHGEPGTLFGEQAMQEELARCAQQGFDAKCITEGLVRAVLEYAGGTREDDMTMLVVRRTGS